MADSLPNIDLSKESPTARIFDRLMRSNQFWKRNLKNNDFVYLYTRGGIPKKIVDKPAFEMFKNGFTTNNERADKIRKEFNLDKIAKFAYVNTKISGKVLIFVDYQDGKQLSEAASTSRPPQRFYVIPMAWVAPDGDIKDKKLRNIDSSTYTLMSNNGGTFEVHKSRIIRYFTDETEMSIFHSAYNALYTADNILWSAGQALFRFGTGFPHIRVTNPLDNANGNGDSEIQVLNEEGMLLDINSESGFISDDRYEIKFVGAEGAALKPKEYWDVVMEYISASIDMPKDILIGLSAGSIAGSEVNTQEYHSVLHARQVHELEPLYNELFRRFPDIDTSSLEYYWKSIWERNSTDVSKQLALDSTSLPAYVQSGIMTREEAREYLRSEYEDQFDLSETIPEEPQRPQPEPQVVPTIAGGDSRNLDINHVRKFYNHTDEEVASSLKKAMDEGSAFPQSVERVENRFMREMTNRFKKTTKQVVNILKAFNTD